MAEFTIQVSDELAQQLAPLQSRLPELLAQLVAARNLASIHASPAYAEVLDFLLTSPTPEAIATFKVSDQAQARLRELLNKNREGALTDVEVAELDQCEQLDQLMILLKAKAYARIHP